MAYAKKNGRLFATAVLAGVISTFGTNAGAAIKINEIFINVPGTDTGQEFFEILSDSGATSLAGKTLITIEGDNSPNAGTIEAAYDLNSFSTGTNGLFLWRDAASVISPAPELATIVNVADFNPDIENGTNTYLLVDGFTGTIGTDYDTDDDGVLDTIPFGTVDDAIGMTENDGGVNLTYAAQFGFTALPAQAGFNPDALYIVPGIGLVGSDVVGTNPGGPYTVDAPRVSDISVSSSYQLTPGSLNPAVPEPATLGLIAVAAPLLMRRRRRA